MNSSNQLLYGPRQTKRPPQLLDGPAGQARVEQLLSQIDQGENIETAVKLLAGNNSLSENGRLLSDGLINRFDQLDHSSWRRLIIRLHRHSKQPQPSLDLLTAAVVQRLKQLISLAASSAEAALHTRQLSQRPQRHLDSDEAFYLIDNRRNPLIAPAYHYLLDHSPYQAFELSLRQEASWFKDYGKQLRSDAYHYLLKDNQARLSQYAATTIFASLAELVRRDLTDPEVEHGYLIAQLIEDCCADQGLAFLAGQRLDDRARQQWIASLNGEQQRRCQLALKQFVARASRDVIDENCRSLEIELSEVNRQRLEEQLDRLQASLVSATVAGSSELLIYSWRDLWLDCLGQTVSPDQLAKGNWPTKTSEALDRFLDDHVKGLFRRQRLNLSESEWRQLLQRALISEEDNYLRLKIDIDQLASQLQRHYNYSAQDDWLNRHIHLA